MDEASRYTCANGLQRRDARRSLDEFLPHMTWNAEELVLDVGCGPGDVTVEVLLSRLPADRVRHLVGSDLSCAMVRHAAERYSLHNVSFVQLDIADEVVCSAHGVLGDLLPAEQRAGFSKVFSFYCLHWVQEQRRAVESIFRLLAPGGETLIVLLARSPMFELYERMATLPKWKEYMTDVARFLSPYQHIADPAMQFHNLLTDVGLEVIHCSCREQTYAFGTLDFLRDSVQAVNPFLDRIPKEMQAAYIDECMAEINKLGLILEGNNNNNNSNCNKKKNINAINGGNVNTRYSLLVAHAKKPSSTPASI